MPSLLSAFTGQNINLSMPYCGSIKLTDSGAGLNTALLILHRINVVKFKQNVQLSKLFMIVWSNKLQMTCLSHILNYYILSCCLAPSSVIQNIFHSLLLHRFVLPFALQNFIVMMARIIDQNYQTEHAVTLAIIKLFIISGIILLVATGIT